MRTIIPTRLLSTTARELQTTLRARYRRSPESAWATHLAWTLGFGEETADPFRGNVHIGLADRKLAFSLDNAVGGPHDEPAPGELFCAAVAACLDATIRLTAARMDLTIERLAVLVTGDVDARGSLGEHEVPVGFQSLRVEVQLKLAGEARPGAAERLLATAQKLSEVLQTLRAGVPIAWVESDER